MDPNGKFFLLILTRLKYPQASLICLDTFKLTFVTLGLLSDSESVDEDDSGSLLSEKKSRLRLVSRFFLARRLRCDICSDSDSLSSPESECGMEESLDRLRLLCFWKRDGDMIHLYSYVWRYGVYEILWEPQWCYDG